MQEDGPPTTYNVVVPRTDYVVEDVWHTVGLRGTGSNDIVIDGAFVPDYRALTKTQVYTNDAPGRALNTSPLFGMPFTTLFPSAITSPVIGMAKGLIDLALEYQALVSAGHTARCSTPTLTRWPLSVEPRASSMRAGGSCSATSVTSTRR